jgi:hypothetical protein
LGSKPSFAKSSEDSNEECFSLLAASGSVVSASGFLTEAAWGNEVEAAGAPLITPNLASDLSRVSERHRGSSALEFSRSEQL